MLKALRSVFGFCVALSGAAAIAEAGPITLTASDMDAVTAGAIETGVLSSATASGPFSFTSTTGNAAAFSAEGSNPAIVAQLGAAAGTAIAVGAGPGASTSTSVSTSGSAGGTSVVNSSFGWTLAVLSGQISGGFTFVSGRTGVFLLGGP